MRKSAYVLLSLTMLVASNCKQRGSAQLSGDEAELVDPSKNRQFKFRYGRGDRDGWVEIMPERYAQVYRDALPDIDDEETAAILDDPGLIWYDKFSMIPSYQDSHGGQGAIGVRPNSATTMASNAHGAVLINYRFAHPFGHTGGTHAAKNMFHATFWLPPKRDGNVLPVKYWTYRTQDSGGSVERWRWTFPLGTVFGEVLCIRSPLGGFDVFEIRTRTRFASGWAVKVLRPYPNARSLASAISEHTSNHSEAVTYLRNQDTLKHYRWEFPKSMFASTFPAIEGSYSPLPELNDSELVRSLLRSAPFQSVEGYTWKRSGEQESYAPYSVEDYSIVPKHYFGTFMPVNEEFCQTCHQDAGRQILDFDDQEFMAYGEIWGEDQIFSWHPFDQSRFLRVTSARANTLAINSDTRFADPNLTRAGLIQRITSQRDLDASLYIPLNKFGFSYGRSSSR